MSADDEKMKLHYMQLITTKTDGLTVVTTHSEVRGQLPHAEAVRLVLPVFVKGLVPIRRLAVTRTEDDRMVDIRVPTPTEQIILYYGTVGAARFFEPHHRNYPRTHCYANQRNVWSTMLDNDIRITLCGNGARFLPSLKLWASSAPVPQKRESMEQCYEYMLSYFQCLWKWWKSYCKMP